MSSFELYASEARERGHMEAIMYVPFVPNGSLKQFNEYMLGNEDWVASSQALEGTLDDASTTSSDSSSSGRGRFDFMEYVFDIVDNEAVVETEEGNGPYMPVWQWSPPPQGGNRSSGSSNSNNLLPIGKENLASLQDESKMMQASQATKGTFVEHNETHQMDHHETLIHIYSYLVPPSSQNQ